MDDILQVLRTHLENRVREVLSRVESFDEHEAMGAYMQSVIDERNALRLEVAKLKEERKRLRKAVKGVES